MARHRYFATTSRGLEPVLAEEVAALGGREVSGAAGGVAFTGDLALGYRANLWLRTANRVLLQLSEFPVPTPAALYEGVRAVAWPELFSVRRTIAVEAAVRESGITHSHFASLTAKDAVVDRFRETAGARPDVDPKVPEVRIHLRILRDVCTLSLDTSGESLNRRGYRADPAEASLRETLAAGIVLLSGWDGRAPLVDPACGAGTIPIEAALVATRTAPGLRRRSFGFQRLSGYAPKRFAALLSEARDAVRRPGGLRIEGSDFSPAAIRSARRNGERAGVPGAVSFRVADIRDLSPEGPPGILLCNPPYGVRLAGGDEELAAFYRAMGDAFKKRCRGWTAFVLSGDPGLSRHIGLKAARKTPLMNGPIDCRLLKYELY